MVKTFFRKQTFETDKSHVAVYGDTWSVMIAEVALVFIVSIWFGIPVVLELLNVTNAAGKVSIYFAFLLSFVGIGRLIFQELHVLVMAAIAFASIFASLFNEK